MKTKLTLNIDDKVIEKAKKFTSRKNISLSSVVENYLAELSTKNIIKGKMIFFIHQYFEQRKQNLQRYIAVTETFNDKL